ncbi:hypothetical protein ACRCRN_28985 [Pseudomonas aeruginosa]
MDQKKTINLANHKFTNPLATRRLVIGESLLDDAKRNLALTSSFGMSFTNGPIYQVPRMMVDLPGVLTAEVAFNRFNMLDVFVAKVQEEAYLEIVSQMMATLEPHARVEADGITFDLGTLQVCAEPQGYGRSPCLTYMTSAFALARAKARFDEEASESVA